MTDKDSTVATEDAVRTHADRVWDILVDVAGARENERDIFKQCWPSSEYRFQGTLGFGGKVRYQRELGANSTRVDCYPEDRSPERDEIVRAANERLAEGDL